MNSFTIAGNLTKDPVLKMIDTVNGQIAKCTFTVALKRARPNQKDSADFIPCTAWRADAENIAKFFTKGRKILIQGHMVSGTYSDASGNKQYTYDWVVDNWEFCDSAKSAEAAATVNPDDYLHTADTPPASTDFTEVDTGTYVAPAETETTQPSFKPVANEDFSLPF